MPSEKLSPADQAKADDAAAKQAAADQAAATQAEADAKSAADDELAANAEKTRLAALAGPADDDGDGDDETHEPAPEPVSAREKSDAAAKRLRLIGMAYPITTPNEHVIFGFGGQMFTLGELRALFNLQGA